MYGSNHKSNRLYFALYSKPLHGSNLASSSFLRLNVKLAVMISLILANEHLKIHGLLFPHLYVNQPLVILVNLVAIQLLPTFDGCRFVKASKHALCITSMYLYNFEPHYKETLKDRWYFLSFDQGPIS